MNVLNWSDACYGNYNVLIKVNEVGFKARAKHELISRLGTQYIGDLITRSEGEISCIPFIGKSNLDSIKEVLAYMGLRLGIKSSDRLDTPEKIKAFYGIKPEQAMGLEMTENNPLAMSVYLPETLVKDWSDEDIIAKIQKRCQNAFNEAVRLETFASFSLPVTTSVQQDFRVLNHVIRDRLEEFKLDLPMGVLKEFTVPLEEPRNLVIVFNRPFLDRVARDISGVTLYPDLAQLFGSRNLG